MSGVGVAVRVELRALGLLETVEGQAAVACARELDGVSFADGDDEEGRPVHASKANVAAISKQLVELMAGLRDRVPAERDPLDDLEAANAGRV